MDTPVSQNYDAIVIGGGPAGSTAATLVARENRRVLLLDRERFPRFRVGESLMPATYWTLKRLGVLDKMKHSRFPRKHSVQFFSEQGKPGRPFYFSETDPHESSVTWQVDRLDFDQMLLDNARGAGVEVCQQANVKDVTFEGSRATGVRVELAGHEESMLRAKVVVDATGQTSLIARKLGLKKIDPQLKHASVFTRFSGAVRDPGIDEGATLIFQTSGGRSWFWSIPLPDGETSVGVVGPIGYLFKKGDRDLQAIWERELVICPALQERLRSATQLREPKALRDFSYISQRIAGDGWVMAGDAFGFLDPIYSSGVFLALQSAEFAADSIIEAFSRDDFSAAQLGKHGERFVAGMEGMRKLVYAYYDPDFHFARFFKQHPECRESMVDLLIGNVFRKPTDHLFATMSRFCDLPEARRLEPSEQPR